MRLIICALLLTVMSGMQKLYAQLSDKVYMTDSRLDTLQKGVLSIEVDNLTFFRNNEYNSTAQKGYTLPGFWLQPKVVYHPHSSVKLEAGIHSIWFWGTNLYPAFAYKEISTWSGRDYAHNVHLLPFFRVHLALSDKWDFILGNLYGGVNHRLIEPLYNPELNLTADPEKGLQLLYNSKRFQIDMWIDWTTFIYQLSTHQESFILGSSYRFNLNESDSRFHFYMPFQGIAQHIGGEIDVANQNIQTIMNWSVGAGLLWNREGRVLKSIKTEYAFVGYYFQKGQSYLPASGTGNYVKAELHVHDFNFTTSYWKCQNFYPISGSTFYSSMSVKKSGMLYKNPSLCYWSVGYVRSFGKGISLGLKADVFRYMSGKMYSSETRLYQTSHFGKNTNYGMEVCFRMTPSFLIKKY